MEMNVKEFSYVAKEIFAPVYPVIAKQIVKETKKSEGKCLDIGTGPGYLGIEMAKATNCNVDLFDINKELLHIAKQNIVDEKLNDKIQCIYGDVHNIPVKDNSYDLVVSRGSVFFWENQVKAFEEIYRILAPNGVAYIGGGFGNKENKEKINAIMQKNDENWNDDSKKRIGKDQVKVFTKKLNLANIKNFNIKKDESGMWIIIRRKDNEV